MYSAPCCLDDASGICDIYMYLQPPYMHVKYLAHMVNNVNIITLLLWIAVLQIVNYVSVI